MNARWRRGDGSSAAGTASGVATDSGAGMSSGETVLAIDEDVP